MESRAFRIFSCVVLTIGVCSAQTSRIPPSRPHYLQISLPSGIDSEKFFVRYALAGDGLGGWVPAVPNASSYVIDTTRKGFPAAGIKAILYAPGCAIQTLDLALPASANPQYSFVCRPLKTVRISGLLAGADRMYGRRVKLQAKYVARWAPSFLGLEDNFPLVIPLGEWDAPLMDGRINVVVPDLALDPWAGASDHEGEIQLWATNLTGPTAFAQLIPSDSRPLKTSIKTKIGGLRIRPAYPSDTVFTPCFQDPRPLHDRVTGFAIRSSLKDSCAR